MRYFFLIFTLFSILSNPLFGSDSTLVIGIKSAPPFINQLEEQPTGLAVDFWEMMDQEVKAKIEYKTYSDLEALITGLRNQEVDMSINPITVTNQRMKFLDFSQPFFISGTAMVRQNENLIFNFLSNFFSYRFLSACAVLLVVIFVFGLLIWIFERRANPEQFGKGAKGIADGFWWSAVTMTTVGYGDKAPVSLGGKVIGFIWMFAAILMISGLTAGIASSLTVTSLESSIESVEDLRQFKTATIQNSSSAEFLELNGVNPTTYESVEAGLEAVANGEAKVFVYDRPILKYYLQQRKDDNLLLVEGDLKTDYYSFSYPDGSPLRDLLDPLVVKALKSEQWNNKLKN